MLSRGTRNVVVGLTAACLAVACGLNLVGEIVVISLPDAGGDAPSDAPKAPCEISPCVVDIAAGYSLTCAAIFGEPPRCWGANGSGQLGSGDLEASSVPRVVKMDEPATRVSAGGWADSNDERPVACALGVSGKVWCWGDDSYGQRGRGEDAGAFDASFPTIVRLDSARQIGVGGSHVCARRDDGVGLYCWGRSHVGQNAKIVGTVDREPQIVLTRAVAQDFALGNFHTCVILTDGTIDCWGLNTFGTLGHPGTSAEPDAAAVPSIIGATIVTAGHVHGCALHSSGRVSCWGHNQQLQLAREPAAPSKEPGFVALPNNVRAVDVCAGYVHSCAVLEGGRVACWGSNAFGQLGDPSPDAGDQSTPAIVFGILDAKRIACGGWHTCVLRATGAVACWGRNHAGQLGRGPDGGDPERHPEPAAVVF